MLVLGKSWEVGQCVCWGANTAFCCSFMWNKIQLIYRNKFQLNYILQSTNGNFERLCPVVQEVLRREKI